jgi:hypothetical protein
MPYVPNWVLVMVVPLTSEKVQPIIVLSSSRAETVLCAPGVSDPSNDQRARMHPHASPHGDRSQHLLLNYGVQALILVRSLALAILDDEPLVALVLLDEVEPLRVRAHHLH